MQFGTILVDSEASTLTLDGHTGTTMKSATGAILVDAEASTLTLDGHTGATIKSATGAILVDSEASLFLTLDGHTGVTIDASNSGNIEINALLQTLILVIIMILKLLILVRIKQIHCLIHQVRQMIQLLQHKLVCGLMDINAGTGGIQMDAVGASQFVTTSGAILVDSEASTLNLMSYWYYCEIRYWCYFS